jgi:CDGSH-type Zn-finger protein
MTRADTRLVRSGDDIAVVRVTPDGPLLVRGRLRLVDEEGHEVFTRRRINALCRCGRSAVQPFCDGTHKIVPFSPRVVDGSSSSAPEANSPTGE